MLHRIILFYFLVYFILTTSSCDEFSETQYLTENGKLDLIIDTDMGLDDIRAILAILADSTINIISILTVEGSTVLGKGTDNLIGLLESYHIESIPIFKGKNYPEFPVPSWRQMANGVGRVPFPPPRHIAANSLTENGIAQLFRQGKNLEYLALGPLGNLAWLLEEHPDDLKKIKKLWLPVIIQNNRMNDWNLLYDIQSAQRVFSSDIKITLLDITAAEMLLAPKLLSKLEGNSRTIQWISQTMINNDRISEHGFFYDDMLAAALIDRELLTWEQQNFRVILKGKKYFDLIPDPKGTITVAKLENANRAFDVLKTFWQMDPLTRYNEHHIPLIAVRDYLRTFHGHLGPYVVIGYRMGQLALKELQSDGHFGLTAEVHSVLRPPHSCLIDGVQLGSGCTLGKRNIQVEAYDGAAWTIFKSDRGEKITIRLCKDIPGLVKKYVDEIGVEAAGEELLNMELSKVFILDE